MRFAIIGAGVIGRTHAACISELAPGATLAVVADEVPGRARDLAATCGAESATSAAAVLSRDDIAISSRPSKRGGRPR